ncbi:MAG: sulfite exporter TauE/SafE family protein [Afipia sp.]
MTLLEIVVLAAAGFAAGTINAIAGGGTFLSFAALVFTGLNTLDANATSAVALTPANLTSAAAYRNEVRDHFREMIPFAAIGLVGGGIGALVLIWIGDGGFRPLVPWLLLLATLLFAFSAQIRSLTAPFAKSKGNGARISAYVMMTVMSIYGGFFGAGVGIMMLAALSIIEGGDYHKANSIKLLMAFLIQVVSAAILIAGGLVHWPHAIVTMLASSAGGYFGVGVARRVPEKAIRAAVVAVGAGLTLIFFLK